MNKGRTFSTVINICAGIKLCAMHNGDIFVGNDVPSFGSILFLTSIVYLKLERLETKYETVGGK